MSSLEHTATRNPPPASAPAVSAIGNRAQRRLDGIALTLTGVCGVHCLLTPVLLIAFPILGGSFLADEHFHLWMLLGILPTAGIATFLGCRKHKDRRVFAFTVVGLCFLGLAVFFGHHHHLHLADKVLTVIGGILLAFGHVRNFRLCRQVACCHDH